jgi:PleD family two-component response regulator
MKILLVEDSRAVAALLMARLATFGHEASLAENGQMAFDMFCESPPDLVLMDIELPVMNGFEATHRIRSFEAMQKWAWTPIVFLTASDSQENLVMAIEAGADDYLVKGVSEDVLHAKMKAMARIASLRQMLAIANLKLEQQASRDGLTGLYNRRWMDLNLDHAWEDRKSVV